MKSNFNKLRMILGLGALLCALPAAGDVPQTHDHHDHAAHQAQADAASTEPAKATDAPLVVEKLTREGVAVEFRATPAPGRSLTAGAIYAGDYVEVSFRLADAHNGLPLQGQFPGAWMDLTRSSTGEQAVDTTCRQRVATYLQGRVGMRPLIDLNSYFILVMNRDASISVIDPITGITGITKLYAQVNLKRPGAAWAKSPDEKRLFVTMPLAGEVAVVDTDTFKVIGNVAAGESPVVIARQPDAQYLWVGNDAAEAAASGVTVIATATLEVAARIPTGRGHHEIAFSDDSRYAFVTNRDDGTVSIVDVRALAKVRDVATGPLPIALGFSDLSRALYVADAEKGEITVIDGRSLEVVERIAAEPGLGPLRFSQDGRWAVAVNTDEDVAYVIDASTNRVAHTVPVGDRPYQVAFSRSFAYVRSLGTERVAMIDLSELGKPGTPPVVTFPAGQRPPEQARDLGIADAIVATPGEAAALVVSPADTTVYYYMEGMNSPMGNFRNYGHMPRAVEVVDRSMQEREPGVYSSTVRLPESGTFEVAFLLDSPSLLHCFELEAQPNPALADAGPALTVEFLDRPRVAPVGETVAMRFRLADRRSGRARDDLADVSVIYFAAPGGRRTQASARHVGDGVYEAPLTLASAGAYYLYVACPSAGVAPNDLPFTTLRAGIAGRAATAR